MQCKHFAYDTGDSECYIFASCDNEAFDEDYTMSDPRNPLHCDVLTGAKILPLTAGDTIQTFAGAERMRTVGVLPGPIPAEL